jgi:DNA uptake protein ComE-like DNA-binding protein
MAALGVAVFVLLAACSPAATPTSAPTAVRATNTPDATAGVEADEPTLEPTEDMATEVATAEMTAEATQAREATAEATERVAAEATSEAVACTKLNLNDLTQDALMATIPDFSARMVREFMEYQPYASLQVFQREIGKYVDEAQIAQYEQYVYVPVDPNESDAVTLQQLPGVDEAEADRLIAGRPYASNEAFLATLADHVTATELAEAACYLASAS